MDACRIIDLGSIGYQPCCELQDQIVASRKAGIAPDLLLICHHPHVITLGRSGKIEHLHVSEATLAGMGVEFWRSKRGGDITYHGPGQLVGYPILDLSRIRRDVVWYVRQLEETWIRVAARLGVSAFRVPGRTGVWTKGPDAEREEKLVAMGVHISRWITSHGFACNVSTDLRYFELITACGIADRRPTSFSGLLGRIIEEREIVPLLIEEFGNVFGLKMIESSLRELQTWIPEAAPAAR